jgi:hypothetical protein
MIIIDTDIIQNATKYWEMIWLQRILSFFGKEESASGATPIG